MTTFSVLRRLDFQDFDFTYIPVAMCGNGGVLLTTTGGSDEVKTFGGGEKILFGGVPRYYIYPASGAAIALDQPAQPAAILTALSDSNVVLSSSPLGIYQSNGAFATLPLEASLDPVVVAMNSPGQIIGYYAAPGGSSFPWLLNPAPRRISLAPVAETYTIVSLAEAGSMAGLAAHFTPVAINDVGWVLLAGASGPGAIVDMSNVASPKVLNPHVPVGSIGLGVAMSNNGWVATQADRAAATISVYGPLNEAFALQIGVQNASWLNVGNINSSGQLVGTEISPEADSVNDGHPFYWDPKSGQQPITTVIGLPASDRIVGAVGINDAGQIAAVAVGGETSGNYGLLLTAS